MSIALSSRKKEIIEEFKRTRGWWDDKYYGMLLEYDPDFLEIYMKYSSHPQKLCKIPKKYVELIFLAADMAPEVLHVKGAQIHIRNALQAGATKEEILAVLELVSTHGIHSVVEGLPLLDKELKAHEKQKADLTQEK